MDHREKKKKMIDMIHHCLVCGELAHECEEGVYRCDDSDCGFSWRVIDCGN